MSLCPDLLPAIEFTTLFIQLSNSHRKIERCTLPRDHNIDVSVFRGHGPAFAPLSCFRPSAMQPAYTSVAARQTLSRPAPDAAPADTQASRWTPEVRAYVRRAFAETVPGIDVSEMQDRLKNLITSAAESGNMSRIDWTTYPLPQQLIIQERMSAMTMHNGVQVPQSAMSQIAMAFTDASPLGKRKSSDQENFEHGPGTVTPPWKKQATSMALEDRITGRPKDKKQKKAAEAFRNNAMDTKADALERRKQRFGVVSSNPTPFDISSANVAPSGPVVGTCQKLEKNYFRLTSAPKPEEVRPVPVLQEMMQLLRKKWKAEHNYVYACDQFKSLRQDLTVQHVKTDFTVKVYEAHARIALEMGDLGEYNQCQTQLRALYRRRLPGSHEEFTAYRILYFIYTCNRADMNNALADLTQADKTMEGVQHALKVRAAVASGNYHRFFKLWQDTPKMGAYLLDKCVPRQRLAALAAICRT